MTARVRSRVRARCGGIDSGSGGPGRCSRVRQAAPEPRHHVCPVHARNRSRDAGRADGRAFGALGTRAQALRDSSTTKGDPGETSDIRHDSEHPAGRLSAVRTFFTGSRRASAARAYGPPPCRACGLAAVPGAAAGRSPRRDPLGSQEWSAHRPPPARRVTVRPTPERVKGAPRHCVMASGPPGPAHCVELPAPLSGRRLGAVMEGLIRVPPVYPRPCSAGTRTRRTTTPLSTRPTATKTPEAFAMRRSGVRIPSAPP